MNSIPMDEEAIFLGAIEKDASQQRGAFLDEACAGNRRLRQRVEALLKSHQQADSFLKEPPIDFDAVSHRPAITEGPGTTIGRYKLLEEIGEGGFGVVYMAEQREPVQRRVALKIIKLGMDTKQVIGRFEAERQALAMMDHPNIAKVLDAGSTETGRPYFVMELVKGVPITEFCDQNKFSTRQRLELFVAVCNAVQHAHQKGIIHRDLKPSNVMVTLHDDRPVPKVIDFGIAKATQHRLTEKTVFTEFKQLIGTPAYMSPEQATFSGLDIDTRSDIYTLGVLLYEVLTGTPPFDEETLRGVAYDELCRIIREEAPPTPSTRLRALGDKLAVISKSRATEPGLLRRLLRGDVDWIVMKALEKDRTRRYDTAAALGMDIQRHLCNEPVLAGPPTAAYRLRKFVARNRTAVLTTAAVATALVIGTVAATLGFVQANQERKSAVAARQETDHANVRLKDQLTQTQNARDGEKAARQEANQSLYVSDMNSARELYEEGNVGRALKLLELHRDTYHERFEWRWLWRLCREGDALRTFRTHSGDVSAAAFSAGGLVATGGRNGEIKLFDLVAGRDIATLKHPGPVRCLAVTPDGETLAAAAEDGPVTLWDVDTRRQRGVLEYGDPIWCLAFTPDGQKLAAGSWDGGRLWDLASHEELITLSRRILRLAFSPDGKRMASVGGAAPVRLWDMVQLSELEPIEQPHASYATAVAFSPDGEVLATGGWDTEIKLWDFRSRQLLKTFTGHEAKVRWLAFSPDGQTVASAGDDSTVRLWPAGDRALSDGQPLATFRGHTASVGRVAFLPGGDTLVSRSKDETIKLWPTGKAEDRNVLAEQDDWVYTVAFSPVDGTLAAGCFDGTVRRYDVETLKTKEVFKRHANNVCTVAFSPSGHWLVSCDGAWHGSWQDISSPGEVRLSSLDGQGRRVNLPAVTGVLGAAFSPDGKTLAIGDHDGRIKIWDLEKRRFTLSKETGGNEIIARKMVMRVRFSPDGKTLAAIHGSNSLVVKLWDAATAELLRTIESAAGFDVAFSPDGKTLATGSPDHAVKLWDVRTLQLQAALEGHKADVMAIRFSPDGKTLASGSVDHTIKLWNIESGQDVATLKGHRGPVSGLAFSRDGTILASSGQDKTVRLWRAASLEEVRNAVARR